MASNRVGSGKASQIYIGIDVHRRSWRVTVRTFEIELWRGSIPASWLALEKLLEGYRSSVIRVVYEAGFTGFWLSDRIIAWGAECVVTPPSLIPSDYGNPVKTDKLDSARLALLLSRGLLKAVWVPDLEGRSHRQVLRRRRQLVWDRVRLQLRIKSELYCFGIEFPLCSGPWRQSFVTWLWRLRLTDRWQTESFQRLLTAYEQLTELIAVQTRLLKELSQTERYRLQVELLTSVPGIGVLTAMEILLELGDLKRFRTGRKLAAYVGLTPSQYSSGERVRLGRISRIGKAQLRASLIEASWILIRKDVTVRQRYQALKMHCGGKRAIVAIARKLLIIVRRMLLDGCRYELQVA